MLVGTEEPFSLEHLVRTAPSPIYRDPPISSQWPEPSVIHLSPSSSISCDSFVCWFVHYPGPCLLILTWLILYLKTTEPILCFNRREGIDFLACHKSPPSSGCNSRGTICFFLQKEDSDGEGALTEVSDAMERLAAAVAARRDSGSRSKDSGLPPKFPSGNQPQLKLETIVVSWLSPSCIDIWSGPWSSALPVVDTNMFGVYAYKWCNLGLTGHTLTCCVLLPCPLTWGEQRVGSYTGGVCNKISFLEWLCTYIGWNLKSKACNGVSQPWLSWGIRIHSAVLTLESKV